MLIGYQRCSTHEQNLDLQTDALTAAGCDRIFTDRMSGAKEDRPGLAEAIAFAREGDILVIWRLDRLSRSLKHLVELVQDLERRGVGLKSLCESLDTSSPGGRLIFHIFGALSQMEREVIRERTLAGLQAARARGKVGGRKPVLTGAKLELARRLRADRSIPVVEACRILGCSRSTFYQATSE